MKPFSERNPITIAVVGLVVLVLVAVGTFYSSDLPFLGGGTTYAADFTDAGGLHTGDDVRVAGVKVGSVDSIGLSGAHVRVEFTVDGAWVGNTSRADIKIKTVLGQEYIAVNPLGSARQNPDKTIPTSRTSTPMDVNAAITGLASTVGSIDTRQLAASFDTLSATFSNTPPAVRAALTGLSSLSRTLASRDTQIRQLATNTRGLTDSLAGANAQFAKLITDGGLLLNELQTRSAAITQLLTGTRDLSRQLSGLVTDNESTLGPALDQLSRVTDILVSNQGNLSRALKLIGPYYTLLDSATGNGRWLDVYLCGLFSNGAPVLNANAKRNCSPRGVR